MATGLHIFNRDSIYYWRKRLPAGMTGAFQKREIVLSLRTNDIKSARRTGRRLTVMFEEFQHFMALIHRNPTPDEAQQILSALYNEILQECRSQAARTYHPDELPADWVEKSAMTEVDHADYDTWLAARAAFIAPDVSIDELREDISTSRYRRIRGYLNEHLAAREIDTATDSHEFRLFLRQAQQIALKAFQDALAEAEGKRLPSRIIGLAQENQISFQARAPGVGSKVAPLSAVPAHAGFAGPNGGTRPTSHYVKLYLEESVNNSWTAGTRNQHAVALDLMIRILTDLPAARMTRSDALALHRTLAKLPKTMGKSSRHKAMSISQIVESVKDSENRMTRDTLDRHWQNIKLFYEWFNRQDDVTEVNISKVFGGHEWPLDTPDGQPREPWSSEALADLFRSPIWTGFALDAQKRYWRHERGETVVQDEYWWLPLIALYQGSRLEEMAMLRVEDIECVNGLDLMRFRGKHLKTDSSKRDIPIHSDLKRLGFLEFVARIGKGFIFPKMIEAGRDGKRGHEFSEKFSEYRKGAKIYKVRMDFHSLRHTFTTRLMNADVDLLIIDELTGHDSQNRKDFKRGQTITLDYFGGFEPRKLAEAIEILRYPELDIEMLVERAKNADTTEVALEQRFPNVWGRSPKRRARRKKGLSLE